MHLLLLVQLGLLELMELCLLVLNELGLLLLVLGFHPLRLALLSLLRRLEQLLGRGRRLGRLLVLELLLLEQLLLKVDNILLLQQLLGMLLLLRGLRDVGVDV